MTISSSFFKNGLHWQGTENFSGNTRVFKNMSLELISEEDHTMHERCICVF